MRCENTAPRADSRFETRNIQAARLRGISPRPGIGQRISCPPASDGRGSERGWVEDFEASPKGGWRTGDPPPEARPEGVPRRPRSVPERLVAGGGVGER